MKSLNYWWTILKDKNKERRRKSGRPSSMSLSEEGSSVSCIVVRAGNRSTFFVVECCRRKSEQMKDAHKLAMHYGTNGRANSVPTLPQRCCVSLFWRGREKLLAGD